MAEKKKFLKTLFANPEFKSIPLSIGHIVVLVKKLQKLRIAWKLHLKLKKLPNITQKNSNAILGAGVPLCKKQYSL